MTSAQRFEIDRILEDQGRLHQMMTNLDRRIDGISRTMLAMSEPPKPKTVEVRPAPPPQKAPPPLPQTQPAPVVPLQAQTPERTKPQREPAQLSSVESEPTNSEPLELRVGTFWMARIGIVILLTGLVFLGNYAYHRIVPLLGPWGKLAMLMLAGTGLSTAGYWMERGKEQLKNFGRVLFAGGAASIYYTTYAAHYVQGLQVIESPLIGGLLLLAVAGGIAWYAERKRSETIASIAVLLSFYTSAINSIAGFTLFSSLLLTAVAIYFLVRHQWTRLSSVSLLATYGSYAYWRFHQFAQPGATESLGMGLAFLVGYWVLFTAGVLFASGATLRPADRVAFLTVNNVAFFGFASHYFAVSHEDWFWAFAIIFGCVLLGLAVFTAQRKPEEFAIDGAYLAQGLIAITAGLAAKFSGPQLSMVLALESGALLTCMRRRNGLLYEIGSYLAATGAFALAMYHLQTGVAQPWSIGNPIAAIFIFNGWWSKRLHRESADLLVSGRTMAFVLPALILVAVVLWQMVPREWLPVALALVPVVTIAGFRIRLAELGLAAQLFVPMAGVLVFARTVNGHSYPGWSPATVALVALAFLHWWQCIRTEAVKSASIAMQLGFAAVAVGTSLCWMGVSMHGDAFLIATSIAAVGTVAYGLMTRTWAVALVGQIFSLVAICTFAAGMLVMDTEWSAALTTVVAMAAVSIIVERWGAVRWPSLPEPWSYAKLAGYYRLAAALLFAAWAFEFVPNDWRVAFFAMGGALQLVVGSVMRAPNRIMAGSLYAVAGVMMFWGQLGQPMIWLDLLALVSIPLSLRIGAWLAEEQPLPVTLRNILVILALFSMWIWVSHWTVDFGRGQLTTAWTVFALVVFSVGLALRERIYRLGGFAVLGLAIGRLFFLDVWRFDSIYRIVSFLVLGAALLALSFVYHRFADSLRRCL